MALILEISGTLPRDILFTHTNSCITYKGKRHQHSLAKIWIESNGQQCVEIAESSLSAKDNEMLVAAINRHWEFINEQVTRAFNGEKTISIDIEK